VLDVAPGERLCVSTDSSLEGVHFRAGWLTPREIGYRAAAAALSDLAAVGATPLAMLVALSCPERWRARLGEVGDGVGEAARLTGASIVGGDTTASPDALALTITVLGSAAEPLTRGGACPGDRVYVTGTLGGSLAALRAFEAGDAPAPEYRDRFARPTPRIAEGRWLAAHGAHAAIDVSDGLVADLGHIAAASGVRLRVDLDRLPCAARIDPRRAAESGEEYELAVVMTGIDGAAFRRETGTAIREVGVVVAADGAAAGVEVYRDGARVDLPRGYDHFSG
jgi:thiamine-monophosphate kinase